VITGVGVPGISWRYCCWIESTNGSFDLSWEEREMDDWQNVV
jgi:hypothetical protein